MYIIVVDSCSFCSDREQSVISESPISELAEDRRVRLAIIKYIPPCRATGKGRLMWNNWVCFNKEIALCIYRVLKYLRTVYAVAGGQCLCHKRSCNLGRSKVNLGRDKLNLGMKHRVRIILEVPIHWNTAFTCCEYTGLDSFSWTTKRGRRCSIVLRVGEEGGAGRGGKKESDVHMIHFFWIA